MDTDHIPWASVTAVLRGIELQLVLQVVHEEGERPVALVGALPGEVVPS